MRLLAIGLLAATLSACGAAAGALGADVVGITARDALIEARTVAATWDNTATLRYVEGEGVTAAGATLPDAGEWRLHYAAPGRTNALVVRVTPFETTRVEQPPTSPPGFVVGSNALGADWIDSPRAMETVLQARGGGPAGMASLLLVPTTPEQWVVRFAGTDSRRWQVDARTGELISP